MSSWTGLAAAFVVAGTLGCSGNKAASPVDDAASPGAGASAETSPGAAPSDVLASDGQGGGHSGSEVTVAVTWPTAPAELLDSGAVNSCGVVRRAPVSVHTLHGVRDVVVMLEGGVGGRAPDPPAMVELVVEDCRVDPAVALARLGARVAVTNADQQRHRVIIERVDGGADEVVAELPLAVIGRRYELALEQPGVYRVVSAADLDSPAYVLVPAQPYFALTDDRGRVEFSDVAPGTYAVTAWHRPLVTGEPAMSARGEVVVVAGDKAELELSFSR